TDGTHLTNLSDDKKSWPIYMTIGNLFAAAQMKHTMHSVLLVVLLPIPNMTQHVLQPLLNSEAHTFYACSTDSNFRHCYTILAAWMADYPEHRDLHNIQNGVC
ncbi:hypothetical protein K440DRAFT_503011, partial [Wilcoxina mikolae CBS 423.85]